MILKKRVFYEILQTVPCGTPRESRKNYQRLNEFGIQTTILSSVKSGFKMLKALRSPVALVKMTTHTYPTNFDNNS